MSKINWDNYKIMDSTTDRTFPEKGEDLKVGDAVEGKLIDIREDVGPNKSMMYIVETSDGELVGIWGSTVIDARLKGIKEGQEMAIEYLGVEKGKSGKEYKNFKIGVKFQNESSDEGDNDLPNTDDIPF